MYNLDKEFAEVVVGWTDVGPNDNYHDCCLWGIPPHNTGRVRLLNWSTDGGLAMRFLDWYCKKNNLHSTVTLNAKFYHCAISPCGNIHSIDVRQATGETLSSVICIALIEWCKVNNSVKDNNLRMEGGYQPKMETDNNSPTGGSNVVTPQDTVLSEVRELAKRVEKLEGLNETQRGVGNELDSIIANIHKIYERISDLEISSRKNEALELLKRVNELEAYHTPFNSSAHSTYCK